MKKAAVFDLDGTLLYSLEDLWRSTNQALAHSGYPPRTLDEVREFVGNGVGRLIHLAVPQGTKEKEEAQCLTFLREYYKEHMREHTRPYDGVPEMLANLQSMGIRTAILSNKFHTAVCELSQEYFDGKIDMAQGEQSGIPRKPDPAGLLRLMEKLSVTAQETVYLGDSPEDVFTAKRAGVDFIGVTWGYRSLAQLQEAGAVRWIRHPEELAKLFGKNQ